MNGCRFLVNLREVQNCERILQYSSLLKENINFWKEDLTSEILECYCNWRNRTREIVPSVLDENSVGVTTSYVAKKFIKRSRCESCKILLKAGDNNIAHDAYLNVLSRVEPFCQVGHLLILCVVTLLFSISLQHILWLYLCLQNISNQNLILPVSTI